MTRIALIDDDRHILTSLSLALEAEGFVVNTYKDGEEGVQGVIATSPDLILLDVKMPRLDGFGMIKQLRQTSNTPVIFLTSRDEEADEIMGLHLGADDYIAKPFSQKLLFERMRAVLRRHAAPTQTVEKSAVITRGYLTLDPERFGVTWRGSGIDVTVTEYLVLQVLADRPGVIKTRDQLIDHAYGESIYVDDRTIDSHIKRLRKKFKNVDENFDNIETLYGAGYTFKE